MAKDEGQLGMAKRAYRNAAAEGNRQEEARWANVIGDILKNRGEYVEALKWLRIDYEVSVKCLPEKQLLPTCQSLGEVYLRLEFFKDALIYQKKHLDLAKDTGDLVEQQRASTQLGRTYHEMFLRSDDDHNSVRNAKKYFNAAMKLAESLKENPQTNKSTFLKEYIDAHNNIGMLQKDLDNLEEAESILTRGLKICDEEEVAEHDDGRTRLHHNLGNVYTELRKWAKAREHIEKDIVICKQIRHCQGEAKGYINLGELYYRVQKYEEAVCCYKKALELAQSMEDEAALAGQIEENIKTVKQATKVMEELKIEEKNLNKLERAMGKAKGTSGERKCLRQQNASLDILIEKASMISAWMKHRDFAKKKKKIASKLCDKEKLSDSYLVIGESYQKLRNFNKAIKWYTKSWELYNTIGNLEGKALAKINIGGVLDSSGNWAGALEAFEEGYKIACDANVPSVQLSALENMHYSHMIRFDNVEEARRLQAVIDKLKESKSTELEPLIMTEDCCSETETQGDDQMSDSRSDMNWSPELSKSSCVKLKPFSSAEGLMDDIPLNSLLSPDENFVKLKSTRINKPIISREPTEASCRSISRSTDSQTVSRKRVRVILSDDEGENDELKCSSGRFHDIRAEDVVTSDELKHRYDQSIRTHAFQDLSPVALKYAVSDNTPVNLEESSCSYKSRSSKLAAESTKEFRSSSTNGNTRTSVAKSDADVSGNLLPKHKTYMCCCDEEHCQHITFKFEDDFVSAELGPFMIGDNLNIASMKVEVACLYYLQLSMEKRSKGLLPIIQHLKCSGRVLESVESIDSLKEYLQGKGWIDVYIDVWVPKRLMQLYIDCCKELSETPNLNLLKKLYNLEVSEDEVILSNCELQDMSVAPLLKALHLHKTVAALDLSHNLLGNETVEKLRQLFTSSSQKYGGLILDLHQNRLGPSALFQICECPVLFARLEVLNISGNRLTDSCASYLAKILKNCKALYSLNIERCSITSRTIQNVVDSLDSGSVLTQLCLGYNHPISRNVMVNLLAKLATLDRFSELNLNGLKLSAGVVDSLCQLAKSSCLSELMLGDTSIGNDGALKLMESLSNEHQELLKLDLSSCGLTSEFIGRIHEKACLINGIIELNLGGNPIAQQGVYALASLLKNSQCCLKVLLLNKCQLGLDGLIRVLDALAENFILEELNLAANVFLDGSHNLNNSQTLKESSSSFQTDSNKNNSSVKVTECGEAEHASPEFCALNTDYNNQLEVADSEDDQAGVKPSVSGIDDSCTSSSKRDLSYMGCQFVQELSNAIRNTKHLQILDLSDNAFSKQAVETLYGAWTSNSRASSAESHIEGTTIHFKVQGTNCCSLKPCCRRI